MAALESLTRLSGLNDKKLTRDEFGLSEWVIFLQILKRIGIRFQDELNDPKSEDSQFLCFRKKRVSDMDLQVVRFLINDLLRTESYTLQGLARYTETTEEFIENVLTNNQMISIIPFTRRLMELHRAVRPDAHRTILGKMLSDMKAMRDRN